MLDILRKMIYTGVVTEKNDTTPPPRFRGEVEIKQELCSKCLGCSAVCPSGALKMDKGRLNLDNRLCLFCGRCLTVCEENALIGSKKYQLAQMNGKLAASGSELRKKIHALFGRSMHIRHVDAGSCNACDFEMNALSNPIYDLQQYGIDFVASPRHADLLMVTGCVTRNLLEALRITYEATPAPKLVMAVGACAAGAKLFTGSYALAGPVDSIIPVDVYVPGCPPRPQALLYGLLLMLDKR